MKLATAKLLLSLGAVVMLPACASIGPPQPPSLELPKPPSDLRATRKGGKVILTWTIPTLTTDRQRVRSIGPTRICRSLEPDLSSCGNPIGEATSGSAITKETAGQKNTTTYADVLPAQLIRDDPNTFATYAIEVLNTSRRGAGISNQVRVPLLEAFPPPSDFAARVSEQGVILTWTGTLLSITDILPVRYLYRVYRRSEGSDQQVLVGQLPAGDEPHPSLTDQSFEWEKTYYYHASTLTVIRRLGKPDIQVDGDDTPEVKVFAHDIFPPAVPSGLQAAFSGPGQAPFIDLIWAPVTDVDLAGYNVYRHEAGTSPEKLNVDLVTSPAYRDSNVASGKEYFYSVSAVDVRGNESAHSEEASENVP